MSKIALAAKSGFGLYFLKETGIGKTIEEKLAYMFSTKPLVMHTVLVQILRY